jgi:iron complex transport system substrate-binding protein
MARLIPLVLAVLAGGLAGALGAAPALELKDDLGREVRLARPAERVVALAPHLAELVHAAGAGDLLVGVSEYSDFPAPVAALPRVGDAFRVDLERLSALRPDLVLAWGSGNPAPLRERVAGLGVPVVALEPAALDDVGRHLEWIGRLTGRAARGAAAARQYRERIAALRAAHVGRSPVRAFYQISDQPLYSVNGKHTISQLVELCGGVNVFAELGPLAPMIGEEAVVQRDPEAIVAGGATVEELRARWGRWPAVAAVARGALYAVDPDVVARATPRLAEGARQICAALDDARKRREAPR